MRGSRKFYRGGPTLTFFLVVRGSKYLKKRADDGPTLNAGLAVLLFFRGSGRVLLRNPIFL